MLVVSSCREFTTVGKGISVSFSPRCGEFCQLTDDFDPEPLATTGYDDGEAGQPRPSGTRPGAVCRRRCAGVRARAEGTHRSTALVAGSDHLGGGAAAAKRAHGRLPTCA